MTGDPLYQPLGTGRTSPVRRSRGPMIGVALIATIAAAGAGWIAIHRDSPPDQSVSVTPIEVAPESAPAAPLAATSTAPSAAIVTVAPVDPTPSGTSVEVQNGVKIIRFSPAASSASITIPVQSIAAVPLKAAPDPRVSETTPDGTLPRIAADGTRPADVYGRPAAAVTGPRIAVLLAGMGADQLATADAARRLLPDLTFGFAPDIADARAQVTEARRAGHEVFLDLTTQDQAGFGGAAPESTAALHRRMAQVVGYAGVLLDQPFDSKVSIEAAERGLMTLQLAPTQTPAVAAADVQVDARQGATVVAAFIDRLIAIARTKGSAIGVIDNASAAETTLMALPQRLAAHETGLVPLSALVGQRHRELKALK